MEKYQKIHAMTAIRLSGSQLSAIRGGDNTPPPPPPSESVPSPHFPRPK